MSMTRQEQIVLAVLQENKPLDARIALREYNIKALATITWNLRKRGYKIGKSYVHEGRRRYTRWELEDY